MKKAPEKDSSERWLLTYSDLMNLLLILFIVLYSMSKTDVQKAQAVAEAIRNAINGTSQVSQVSSANTSATGVTSSGSTDYTDFYNQLVALINKAGMQSQVEVLADASDVVITLKDSALFASGSPNMNPDARALMYSIGGLLNQVNFELVMVEGYTDNDPMHSAEIPDNLELSTKRANGVNRVLQQVGVPTKKIVSMGYGENNPVAPNDTPANKALNRRVVLTIFKNTNGLTPTEIIAAKELLGTLNSGTPAQGSGSSSSSSTSSSKPTSSGSSSSKASSSKAASSGKATH